MRNHTFPSPLNSCTENEARRYARFLNETFGFIHRWYKEPAVFEAEAGKKAVVVCCGYQRLHVCHSSHALLSSSMRVTA